MHKKLQQLLQKLNYKFKNIKLLYIALTHSSYNGDNNNERLELLGDSVLSLVILDILLIKFSHSDEGVLSRLRSSLVCKDGLLKIANKLNLFDYILIGKSELQRKSHSQSIIANTVEAIIGAIYTDSNSLIITAQIIQYLYKESIDNLTLQKSYKDYKTTLQEYLQSQCLPLPEYKLKQTIENKKGEIKFTISCHVSLLEHRVIGKGYSKRKAEQNAAKQALFQLHLN